MVEAMLSGVIPLLPADKEHHLCTLVSHGESGFLCTAPEEFGQCARLLEKDSALRVRMSERAHALAEQQFCNAEQHRECWRRLFYGPAAR